MRNMTWREMEDYQPDPPPARYDDELSEDEFEAVLEEQRIEAAGL